MALYILNKICTGCLSELPTFAFSKSKEGLYGHTSACKTCSNMARKIKRQANPKNIKEYNNKWRQLNLEQARNYQNKWRKSNREKIKEYSAKWYKANTERAAEIAKKTRQKQLLINPERIRERKRKACHKRRLLLADARCDLTLEQWNEIKAFYNQRCAFCNKKTKLTQDHFIPVTKGGEHTASNIIPLCQSCNSSKGNREVKKTFQPHLFMGSGGLK